MKRIKMTARFTPEERAKIERIAKRDGISLSDVIQCSVAEYEGIPSPRLTAGDGIALSGIVLGAVLLFVGVLWLLLRYYG